MKLTKETTIGDLKRFQKRLLKGHFLNSKQMQLILNYTDTTEEKDREKLVLDLKVDKAYAGSPVVLVFNKNKVISQIIPSVIPVPVEKAPTRLNKAIRKPNGVIDIPKGEVKKKVSENGLNGVVKLANGNTVVIDYGATMSIKEFKVKYKEKKRKEQLEFKAQKAKRKQNKMLAKLEAKKKKMEKKYGTK